MQRGLLSSRVALVAIVLLGQGGLCLWEPKDHLHSAVEVDGSREGSTGLCLPSCRAIQRPKAMMTVGLERAHAEFLGQGEGLPVVIFYLLGLRRVAMPGEVAEESEDPRLSPAFLVLTGECEGLHGKGVCVRQVTGTHIDLAHPNGVEHNATGLTGPGGLSYSPFQ